ncbi:MAG: amidohydrolase family protein [Armatimonadetes bacterium]|nr:amidohydrolase family protein [Armatimonadota bacterium]
MSGFALIAALAFAPVGPSQDAPKVASHPQNATWVLKGARVVVRPGVVRENTDVYIKDGSIVDVGPGLNVPEGTAAIDCTGLTAYAGLIQPFMRVSITGTSPAAPATGGGPGGGGGGGRPTQTAAEQAAAQAKRDADPFGRETNLLTKTATGDLKQKDVSAFVTLRKSGYVLAQVCATGGLVGPTSAVYGLGSGEIGPDSVKARPGFVPFSTSSRGFGSYPSSAMGAVAFIRQTLYDAGRYGRIMKDLDASKTDPALDALGPIVAGSSYAVFDDLTEITYFQSRKVAKEFGLKTLCGFREDAGSVKDLLRDASTAVMLKGNVPTKPSIGTDLATASLSGVRTYFNEVQAGAEMEKAGIEFCYSPSSTADPLDGIRTYVRGGLSRDAALASMTTRPAALLGVSDKAGTIEAGKDGSVVLTQGDLFDSKSQVMAVFVGGHKVDFKMPDKKKPEDLAPDGPLPVMPPNHGLFPKPAESTPAFRLYKNATVWTQGPEGVIKGGDVLIKDGKIVSVGRGLKAPAGCEVVDATGRHLSPGIWDCHSHTGINGGVNEGTNMITIECRIADVINHQAPNIYQQLSGGTVGAQQLHGSANAIGGQSSPVKWRWGLRPTEFPIADAPSGVKFALGQNPIREDATGGQQPPVGTTLLTFRPRTRMGVEEAIRKGLQQGKEYNDEWAAYRDGKTKFEPRRDLQLEGLGEVVSGRRLVHSHGYRSDELLMLVRVVKEFGGKIATLQHVLEGYKIADEMAAEGIGGSTFADWWGYKLEAYDAIPYNAALMADRGVSVSVNSDSDNHARRLNQEAAKSMRYGGVSAEKALSFVTIEPARQMGIASHTGSIEPGKDADLALWTTEPTSVFAVCLETYVDGVKRFDRADDARQRAERDKELTAAKALLVEAPKSASGGSNPFDSGSGSPALASDGGSGGKSTARFGIGPVKSEPATMRYPRRPVLISGATVHPMDGAPFVGDVLLGSDGKVQGVGRSLRADGAETVNGRGKHVYPGLIDPATGIGLNEIGQVPASDDSSERGNFHPDYRVERTINPEWETLGVARQQGVLTVLVKPSGSGISGQAALINTEGFTWEDLTVKGGAALTFSSGGGGFDFGDDGDEHFGHGHDEDDDMTAGQNRRGGGGTAPASTLSDLSNRIKQARAYLYDRDHATPEQPVARDQQQEAMAEVALGKMPVILSVNSAAEIKAAVAWAEKESVQVVLYGCSGAGSIADWLAERQVPICLAAVYQLPTAEQPVDAFYTLPAKLAKAGVKFCLTTNNDKDVRQIRDQAGWAAAYGVDREEAARLITLRTAEVLGIQDRLGSIKAGMDGTVILTDGEIIETKTKVLRAWIQSREVDLENRQTRLYDKYRKRPRSAK